MLTMKKTKNTTTEHDEETENGLLNDVRRGVGRDVDAVRSWNVNGWRSQPGAQLCHFSGDRRRRRQRRRRRRRVIHSTCTSDVGCSTFGRHWIPIHDGLNTIETALNKKKRLSLSLLFSSRIRLRFLKTFWHYHTKIWHFSSILFFFYFVLFRILPRLFWIYQEESIRIPPKWLNQHPNTTGIVFYSSNQSFIIPLTALTRDFF